MSCGACSSSGPTVLELLQQTPLYAYLDDKELEQLADAFVRKKIAKGKELPESPLYVLLSGEVEIIQNGKTLCKKHEGAFFSRRAGMLSDKRRSSLMTRNSKKRPETRPDSICVEIAQY